MSSAGRLLLLLSLVATGCAGPAAPPPEAPLDLAQLPPTTHRRLLLVYVDTLRRDHLGMYGYTRDTTPRLDAWARGAAVFDNAWSVAPWTLPAARAALSGRQPEHWAAAPTLPERLAAAGWDTAAFISNNLYLTDNFDMERGWAHHEPAAASPVAAAHAWFAAHPDRDEAVLVHLMDTHLSYDEPAAYRGRWAADTPPEPLPVDPTRVHLFAALAAGGDPTAINRWLTGRADQSLRYVDDQVGTLLDALDDDAVVVLFSDHGEEFLDHGSFEHGHTVYDELLRVPLAIRAPGMQPGRYETPVSLLDVTPTVAALVGLDPAPTDGRSLAPAGPATGTVPLAFGRPLYGEPCWGVVLGRQKWSACADKEALYDLDADPGESRNLLTEGVDPTPLRAAFAESLGRAAPVAWRVSQRGTAADTPEATLTLRRPGGFDRAWIGTRFWVAPSVELSVTDGVVTMTLPRGRHGAGDLYAVPNGDPTDFTGLVVTLDSGDTHAEIHAEPNADAGPNTGAAPGHADGPRLTLRSADRAVEIGLTVAPVPEDVAPLVLPADMAGQLEALGYVELDGG